MTMATKSGLFSELQNIFAAAFLPVNMVGVRRPDHVLIIAKPRRVYQPRQS